MWKKDDEEVDDGPSIFFKALDVEAFLDILQVKQNVKSDSESESEKNEPGWYRKVNGPSISQGI